MFALAGFFKAMADTLRNKYNSSIFRDWNHWFWDPMFSWRNKYKHKDISMGPKWFGLSTTILVFMTDGWHLSNFFRNTLIALGIGFILASGVTLDLFWGLMVCIPIYKIPFATSTELFLRLMVNSRPLLKSTEKMSYFQWLRTNGKNYLVWSIVTMLMFLSTIFYAVFDGMNPWGSLAVCGTIFILGTSFIIRAYYDYKNNRRR
jgi:hypothetical protein